MKINETENRKKIEKTNEKIFEKIKKIDKQYWPSKKEENSNFKNNNERWDITIILRGIKRKIN